MQDELQLETLTTRNKLNLSQFPTLFLDQLIGQLVDPTLNSLSVVELNAKFNNIPANVESIYELKSIYVALLPRLHLIQLQRLKLVIGTLIFRNECLNERIQLKLSTLTSNKVRVDRLSLSGYVPFSKFFFIDKLMVQCHVFFDMNNIYKKDYLSLAHYDVDHRIDVVWSSNEFSIGGQKNYTIQHRDQFSLNASTVVFNMATIHSRELERIMKQILGSLISYNLGYHFEYANYVNYALFTLPIESKGELNYRVNVPTSTMDEYKVVNFYSRQSSLGFNSTIYDPPVRWRFVADGRFAHQTKRTLPPMTKVNKKTNTILEDKIFIFGLKADSAGDELLASNVSVVNFNQISPLIDPINRSWPWSIRQINYNHSFTEPQQLVENQPVLQQQHTFPFVFILE